MKMTQKQHKQRLTNLITEMFPTLHPKTAQNMATVFVDKNNLYNSGSEALDRAELRIDVFNILNAMSGSRFPSIHISK